MNDNARKWIEALRSGKYNQTQSRLHDNDGYCCLGVACDLYNKENPGILHVEEMKLIDGFKTRYNGLSTVLPDQVTVWLGLAQCDGDYKESGQRMSLVEKNDNGYTFAQIADIIESEPEGLFV